MLTDILPTPTSGHQSLWSSAVTQVIIITPVPSPPIIFPAHTQVWWANQRPVMCALDQSASSISSHAAPAAGRLCMIITSGHQHWVPTQLKTLLWFPYYQFRSRHTSWFSDHTRGKSGSWTEQNSDIIFQNKKISLKNSHPEQIRIICQSFLINDEGKKCIRHFLDIQRFLNSFF